MARGISRDADDHKSAADVRDAEVILRGEGSCKCKANQVT